MQALSLALTADAATANASPPTTTRPESSGNTACMLAAWVRQLPLVSLEDAMDHLPWIQPHSLDLTMECIGSTSIARVVKVGAYITM